MSYIQKFTVKGFTSIKVLEDCESQPLNGPIGANRATDYFNIGDWASCQSPSRRG